MKKIIIAILFPVLLVGCGLFKTKTKHSEKKRLHTQSHTTEQVVETGVRIERIEPDSILFNHRLIIPDKDSVYEKQTAQLDLKIKAQKGKVRQTVCRQKPKFTINPYQRKEQKQTDVETKQTQRATDSKSEGATFKPIYAVYLFVGLGFLIVVNNLTKRN